MKYKFILYSRSNRTHVDVQLDSNLEQSFIHSDSVLFCLVRRDGARVTVRCSFELNILNNKMNFTIIETANRLH